MTKDDARLVGVLQVGEGERSPQLGVGPDEAGVDAERVVEGASHVLAEQVVADL